MIEFLIFFVGIFLVKKTTDFRNGIVVTKIGVLLFLLLPFLESLTNVVYILYNAFNDKILFFLSFIFTLIVPCGIFLSFLFILKIKPRPILWIVPPLGIIWIVLGKSALLFFYIHFFHYLLIYIIELLLSII